MRRLALLPAVLACACQEPSARPGPPPPDKAALYGDGGLVPTREGERARRELALAGQIHGALSLDTKVQDVHVDVTLQPGDGADRVERVAVSVVGDVPEEGVHAIVRGITGPVPDGSVHVALTAPSDGQSRAVLDFPLALALLGLGFSLGVTVERGRRRH